MSDELQVKKKLKKTDLVRIKEEKYLIVDSTGEHYMLVPVSRIIDGDFNGTIDEILLPQIKFTKIFFEDNNDYELLGDYEKLMLLVSKNSIIQKTLKKFLKI